MNPMGLWCALDENNSASGSLFMDDGESIGKYSTCLLTYSTYTVYKNKVHTCKQFSYWNNRFYFFHSTDSIPGKNYLELRFTLQKV